MSIRTHSVDLKDWERFLICVGFLERPIQFSYACSQLAFMLQVAKMSLSNRQSACSSRRPGSLLLGRCCQVPDPNEGVHVASAVVFLLRIPVDEKCCEGRSLCMLM